MDETELLILGLCVAIPILGVIAGLLDVPYPIVLVLGAIPLGYLPAVPNVELDPELVLVIFLPPRVSRVLSQVLRRHFQLEHDREPVTGPPPPRAA